MRYIVVTVVLMGLIMLAMAVGVMVSGKALKGSCGGVGGPEDCFCEQQGIPKECKTPEDVARSAERAQNMPDGVTVYGGGS
ncbi:MAG: hypothetical protein VX589_21030 [Myxococcota bacterium]|nr:hypothetical protein [Myxococcota bacterium]